MSSFGKPQRWLILCAFAAVYIIWGWSYLGIRFAVETIPPFIMSAFRFVLAGAILMIAARMTGNPLPTRIEWRTTVISAIFMFVFNNGGIVWAQAQGLPSGIAALLVATAPFWYVIATWVLNRRRPAWGILIGIVIGFGGIALLINPTPAAGTVNQLIPMLVVLACPIFWVIGSLYSRSAPMPASGIMATGMQLLLGGLMLAVLSVVTGELAAWDIAAVSLKSLIALLVLALFNSTIAFTSFVWLMRVVPPAQVATYAYVNPVVALFLGWLLAGEMLDARSLVASAIILGSVVLITRARATSDRAVPAPAPPRPVDARSTETVPVVSGVSGR